METTLAPPSQPHVLYVLPQQPGEPVTAVMDRIREAISDVPQAEIEVTHYHAEGLLARQAVIQQGVTVVGKIHLTGHINVLLEGTIDVMTELGVERYTAPAVIVSQAGEQKVGYALTKTTWLTIHATTETDPDKIEQQLVTTDLTKRGIQ